MIFIKSALSLFKKKKFGNIISVLQIITAIVITAIMISSVCIRYQKYTPFADYFKSNGLIVRAGWGMNLDPEIRDIKDGIENDNVKELFSGVDKVIASHSVEAYLDTGGDYSPFMWSYDDEIIKNYNPEIKSGRWFNNDDIDDNKTIKVVISENNYGWSVGDTIPISFVNSDVVTFNVEIIGIFKNGEDIVGGNFESKNNDFNDFYYTYDSKFEGTPCILFSSSQLSLFSNDNNRIYQPISTALIKYSDDVSDSQLEEDINQWSKYDAESSYTLKQLNSNSSSYLYEQIYNLLPIIILLILLIATSCISMSAISTEKLLRNYAIYYINGLQWKHCIFINLIQSIIISLTSIILSVITVAVIKYTPLNQSITFIMSKYTILSVIALIIVYMLISMIMPAIIIGKNTPKQILTR